MKWNRWMQALCLFVMMFSGLTAHAQDQARWLDVEVGQSIVYRQDRPIARILISDDKTANINLLEEGQFQVRGLAVGSTDLWVWFRDDRNNPVRYELTVHRDLSDLIRRIDQTVDGAPPKVYPLLDRIVVDGPVPDLETLERVMMVVSIYDKKAINNMTVTGDHQVQLEVVFAELNRSGNRALGLNAIWGSNVFGFAYESATSTTTAFASRPEMNQINTGTVLAPAAGAFTLTGIVGSPLNLAAILGIMEGSNLSKVLARPKLVALSGQEAEFLAGGQLPIPMAGGTGQVSITFREYGIKMSFVPTVLAGDVIDLVVAAEVSEVDSGVGINVTGFEVPGFSTKKTSSHVRLESGQTFALAGLLHDQVRSTVQKIPLLGDIPLIGFPFRSVSHNRIEQEVVVFVTPKLVRPMNPEDVPAHPGAYENNNPTDFELFFLGLDHQVGSKTGEKDDDDQSSEPAPPAGEMGAER